MADISRFLKLTVEDRIATIEFHKPDGNNLLDYGFAEALKQVLEQAENDSGVRAVVLTSAHVEYFCAGVDPNYLYQVQQLKVDENIAESAYFAHLFHQIIKLKKPVVAAVEGAALSEGAVLTNAADFVIAGPQATFGYPDVRFGNIPAVQIYFALHRLGRGTARRLFLTGEVLNAQSAEQLNIVDEVTKQPGTATERATQFARQLARQNAIGSTEFVKKMVADLPFLPPNEGIAFSAKINAHGRQNSEFLRGLQARANEDSVEW